MIKASKNTFKGGMSKDPAVLKQQPSTYTDALDIRVSTDHGGTEQAVINIKGNEHLTDIPDVPSILLLEPNWDRYDDEDYTVTTFTVTVYIDGNAVVSDPITVTEVGVEARIAAIADALLNSAVFGPYNLQVVVAGTRVRVWSTTNVVSNYTDSEEFLTSNRQTPITASSQRIIGWVNVRGVFYVWTTNNTTAVGGIGTLWELTYNKDTNAATWVMKYSHSDMLMSTQYPIANPSAIEAAYENSDYLRIAFTDFFNPLRILNVYDPTLMALAPAQFELQGGVLPYKPIFEDIQLGGSLPVGTHQIAARYRTSSGGYSKISPISNMVHVVSDSEDDALHTYNGDSQGTATNKALLFQLTGIDTSYDFLEIIHVFKDSKFATPQVQMVAELDATTTSMSYLLTGKETAVELTLDIFVDVDKPFTHCKTIAQKDNILFAGNTKNERFKVSFDATAKRYGINPFTGPETYTGNVNPDQDIYQYQSDGVTIGGTGANVSYKIIKQRIDGDVRNPNDITFPNRFTNPVSNTTVSIGGDNQFWGDHYGQFASPWLSGLVRGYKRGEVYRFGFVPIKDGVDGDVEWIDDIQMPWVNSQNNIYDDYKLLYNENGDYVLYTLGVEFTVDISSIQSEIDGFRIVRVERTEEDKTMMGAGLLSPMIRRQFDDRPVGWYLSAAFGSSGRPSDNHHYHTNPDLTDVLGYSWHCPDYLFGKPFTFRDGDQIVITGGYQTIDQQYQTAALGPVFNIDRWKLYTDVPVDLKTIDIEDAAFCERGTQQTIAGEPFVNFAAQSVDSDGNVFTGVTDYGDSPHSIGTDTIMMKLEEGVDQTNNNEAFRRHMRKLYVEYKRPNAAQYGGTTDAAKANNVYIDTGTLVRVTPTSNSSQTVKVFGGDTFVTVWDSLKMYRNFDVDDSDDPDTFGVAIYSPIETDINLELRHGNTFNSLSNLFDTAGAAGYSPKPYEEDGEDFFYNYAYSAENSTKVFLPEPITGTFNEEYSERIYASIAKVKGEIVDSWRDFRVDIMIDLEGNHGPINALLNNSDSLFALQDRAFGKASVNERATVTTSEGSATTLGTTGVLQRFDYISTHSGSLHQHGLVNSPMSIYFFDAINGELNRYSGGKLIPISTTKGMKAFFHDSTKGEWLFNNDNPIYFESPGVYKGITGTYDYRYDEVLLTFHVSDEDGAYAPFTIGYDEEKNTFTSFYSFKPTMYLNDKFSVISVCPEIGVPSAAGDLYIHHAGTRGVFYGNTPSECRIELVVNDASGQSKIFTNLEWSSTVRDANGADLPGETIDTLQMSTDYQSTSPADEFRRRFRTWRHQVGRDLNGGDRIRDHYAKVKMTYQNEDDKKLILNDVTTIYDILPL